MDIDGLTDGGNLAPGLQLILFPAGRKILELDNAFDYFTPCSQGRIAPLVQAGQHSPRDREFVHAVLVASEFGFEIRKQVLADASAAEKGEYALFRAD